MKFKEKKELINMNNLYSNRQLVFADENNDKESITISILEVLLIQD